MNAPVRHLPRDPPSTRLNLDHLSYSSIRTFQACPRRFYYRYVMGLPEGSVSSSLVVGRAVHAALEFHFQTLLEGHRSDVDTLLQVFWEAWRVDEKAIRFVRGDDINVVGRLADRLLRGFLASGLSQPGGTIIAVEEELRRAIVPGCPDFVGRVDLVLEDADAVVLIDFKTTRSAWGDVKVAEAAPQLLLYSELAKSLAGDKPMRLAFAVMTKAKAPSFTLHPVSLNPDQVEETRATIAQVWRAIRAACFFANPSALNCLSCPFRGKPCRAWTG